PSMTHWGEAYARLWHLQRLLAADEEDRVHRAARARAYLSLGRWEEAVADLTRVLDGKGKQALSASLWAARGRAHAELGRWAEAEADLTRALEAAGKSLAYEDWETRTLAN